MGKKNCVKTNEQRAILEQFYSKNKCLWNKQQITVLSQKINLSKQRVYKYLWDMKNQDKRMANQKRFNQLQVEEEGPKRQTVQVPNINLRYFGHTFEIPSNFTNVNQFQVDQTVTEWTRQVLQQLGWRVGCLNFRQEFDDEFEQSDDGLEDINAQHTEMERLIEKKINEIPMKKRRPAPRRKKERPSVTPEPSGQSGVNSSSEEWDGSDDSNKKKKPKKFRLKEKKVQARVEPHQKEDIFDSR